MKLQVYLKNYVPNLPENTLVYCDPPYFVKGSDLYPNYYAHKDHIRLSEVIQSCVSHRWILSYDGAPEIIEMYRQRRHFLYDLQYSAAKAYMGKEIFIFSDSVRIPSQASIKSIDYALSRLITS